MGKQFKAILLGAFIIMGKSYWDIIVKMLLHVWTSNL